MIHPHHYKVNPETNCWEWTYSLASEGYGQVWCPRRKQTYRVHRVMWEQVHESIPKGMCILHKCDNRKCVNPDHLWLGTLADNSRDAWNKGKFAHIEKLNEERRNASMVVLKS